ncbi:Uncharacterized protein YR821_1515 [Yersinia ruckeri]|uniref:Uncharacterized protein n=1 Tax=Yersinia ruckeri TaxID=29486 RepID=A0A0A8VIB8_YERRU|nr:hypothetical protein yruck0001_16460 [Yersinia ruckeri ATCC 29473]QTD76440.1 Uncharacterized protein YR821_1515 [Yersinia ruckeri]CEK27341.1 hypothetical protein CSF007_7925 [Yersinia ruckeri]
MLHCCSQGAHANGGKVDRQYLVYSVNDIRDIRPDIAV